MVIDSANEEVKHFLIEQFSSDLIRFYVGQDLIGSEVGEMMAETLGLPFVADIVEAAPADAGLRVRKELEAGYLMVDTALPRSAQSQSLTTIHAIRPSRASWLQERL